MPSPIGFSRKLGVTLVAGASGGVAAIVAFALCANMPALSRSAEDDAQVAKSLATMLSASRTVISKNQDRINDPNIGDKGIDGKMVTTEAAAIYQKVTGTDPTTIDPVSLEGHLIHMQLDSIVEVMDAHQETINRQGVGFKGFIPAVFTRLVNEAFGRRAGGVAEIKVSAPPMLVRNPKMHPDAWEAEIIKTKLLAPSWPKGQSYTALVDKDGVQAERTIIPEYYGRSCLTCHGSPQGEIDITGYPKEGANEGDLGGIISIALYR